jgi:hypothetical protein
MGRALRSGRKQSLAQTETSDTVAHRGRSARAARPAILRYAGRHVGFLAGLLIVAVATGVAYRYLFDRLEE